MSNKFSGITLIKDRVDEGKSPELTCSAANEMTLEKSSLRITGNIGSGAWLPGAKLVLNAPNSNWIFLRQERSTSGGGGFGIHNPWGEAATPNGSDDRNRLEIAYKPSQGDTLYEQFVIHGPTGNVGIGLGKPEEKFHVAGKIKANDGAILKNSLAIGIYSPPPTAPTTPEPPENKYGYETIRTTRESLNLRLRSFEGIFFHTNNQPEPNFSFTKGGNVGIGATVPWAKLVASSSIGTWIFLRQERASEGGGGFLLVNSWASEGQYSGPERNRLEIAYKKPTQPTDPPNNPPISTNTLWNQIVLHGPTGNVGINTGTPQEKLHVEGNIRVNRVIENSSRELKQNIDQLCIQEAVAILADLEPVKFNYKDDNAKNQRIGFIAEDVPDLVATADRKGVPIMDIVGVLTKVVQVQQKTISALGNEVKLLKERNLNESD